MKYRVYRLGSFVRSFTTRDEAVDWVCAQPGGFDDFEVLDRSDG